MHLSVKPPNEHIYFVWPKGKTISISPRKNQSEMRLLFVKTSAELIIIHNLRRSK
ncbi:MAG: hypothetical protein ACTS6G_00380 [Candidatus Hodgkinia cicadicola]